MSNYLLTILYTRYMWLSRVKLYYGGFSMRYIVGEGNTPVVG